MIVTATQIKINFPFGFLRFIPRLIKIRRQLNQSDGLLFVKFNGARTLTGWSNTDAMKAFRNNGHHLDAMKNIKKIGKSKSISWEASSEPGWHEAISRLDNINY